MFGPARLRLNMPTRRRKERPKKLRLRVVGADGHYEDKPVPVEDHPLTIVLGRFYPPDLIQGFNPAPQFRGGQIWNHTRGWAFKIGRESGSERMCKNV